MRSPVCNSYVKEQYDYILAPRQRFLSHMNLIGKNLRGVAPLVSQQYRLLA